MSYKIGQFKSYTPLVKIKVYNKIFRHYVKDI